MVSPMQRNERRRAARDGKLRVKRQKKQAKANKKKNAAKAAAKK